jgi:hypothetical protein
LATLRQIDIVMDARRRGIDPRTGKPPRTHATKEKLRRQLQDEPARLEHAFQVLIDIYADAFGTDAADAFAKAIRAWHAGIPVETHQLQAVQEQHKTAGGAGQALITRHRRLSAMLPVPKPLHTAVKLGRFGTEEDGQPVRPKPDEVRAITDNYAEKLIDLLDQRQDIGPGLAKYAEDFGPEAAGQLERYARRQCRIGPGR